MYDQRRVPDTYQVNDKVMVRTHVKSSLKDNINKSLAYMYEGFFVVDKLSTANTLLVHSAYNVLDIRKVHVNFVKRYRERRDV